MLHRAHLECACLTGNITYACIASSDEYNAFRLIGNIFERPLCHFLVKIWTLGWRSGEAGVYSVKYVGLKICLGIRRVPSIRGALSVGDILPAGGYLRSSLNAMIYPHAWLPGCHVLLQCTMLTSHMFLETPNWQNDIPILDKV